MRFILTSCGLSILTNYLQRFGITPKEVYRYSNFSKEEIDVAFLSQLEKGLQHLKNEITTFTNNELKKLGAELNALITFYDGRFDSRDIHLLFHTDTYLGQKAAEILQYFLREKGLNVQLFRAKDLNTASLEEFHIALSDVVKELSEMLQGYKQSYEIIFNLTGGYKSVNSFLQTMATLWADRSIYIFETSDELLTIPRLPLKIDEEIFKKHYQIFRVLELGLNIEKLPKEIPLSLINQIGDEYSLSPWGAILWQKVKLELYKDYLVQPIQQNIIIGKELAKQFENFNPNEKIQINKTIDKIERYMAYKENPRSLRLHPLTGTVSQKYNLECYPFDGNDSRRLYCNSEGNRIVLEKIDDHLK